MNLPGATERQVLESRISAERLNGKKLMGDVYSMNNLKCWWEGIVTYQITPDVKRDIKSLKDCWKKIYISTEYLIILKESEKLARSQLAR